MSHQNPITGRARTQHARFVSYCDGNCLSEPAATFLALLGIHEDMHRPREGNGFSFILVKIAISAADVFMQMSKLAANSMDRYQLPK